MENWKQVKDFDNYYISDLGSVKNKNSGKILMKNKSKKGYIRVYLFKDGKTYTKDLHRLVATHFLPNFYNKNEIDHIDNDKSNNKVYNLRWATRQENCRNRKKAIGMTSKYKGVCFNKQSCKWISGIKINQKRISLGYFDNELDAGKKYNEYIIENKLEKYFILNEF
jgi:HNH endonuclease/NUMOD4 motif